jgi:NADH dehydrogenase FAD-containing subunit
MEIIILGAGYAWIFAAANLCKHLSIKSYTHRQKALSLAIATNSYCSSRYKKTIRDA